MQKRTAIGASLILGALVGIALPVGATDPEPALQTSCEGGATDGRSTNVMGSLDQAEEYILVISALRAAQPYDVYIAKADLTLWEDDNGVAGVQRTARMCYEVDENYRVVNTYELYPADDKL